MANNATKCKHRAKYGWFLLKKYRCEMALNGKEFLAKRDVCNTCDGPKLEDVHDCTYFKIGTEKPHPDRNTVIVKGYDFRVYKDEKDFRNEIIDLGTCRPECPHYKKRPISEPLVYFQKALAPAKPVTSSIPFGLKIWTFLPVLPVAGLGIYRIAEEIRYEYGTDMLSAIKGNLIAMVILVIAFYIGLFSRLLLKEKRAFSLYKLLIFLTVLGWGLLFYGVMKGNLWTSPREFIDAFLILCSLSGTIISTVVLFSKLPKIKVLLYPEKGKAKPKWVFSWVKGHLLKGDIIVILLIIFIIIGSILSSKNNKSDIPPPPAPAFVPEAPAPEPEPAPAPAPAPEPPEYAPAPAPAPASKKPTAHDTQEMISRYLKLGNAFHEEGNYDRAIEMFNRVLNMEPDNKDALKGKERAKEAKAAEERVLRR